MRVAMKLVVLGLVSLASFGGICGDDGPTAADIGVELRVRLINLDTDNVHLFAPGQSFEEGCPPTSQNCRLAPNESRTVFLQGVGNGERLVFAAGRLGNIFTTKTCTVSESGEEGAVEFQLDQSLHCKEALTP